MGSEGVCFGDLSALWNVGAVAVAVNIVLSSARTLIDGLSAAVVVGTDRVVLGAIARGTGEGIGVAEGGVVVPVGIVGVRAVMSAHYRAVSARVAVLVAVGRVGVAAVERGAEGIEGGGVAAEGREVGDLRLVVGAGEPSVALCLCSEGGGEGDGGGEEEFHSCVFCMNGLI